MFQQLAAQLLVQRVPGFTIDRYDVAVLSERFSEGVHRFSGTTLHLLVRELFEIFFENVR